jgi:hypothetical protein
MGVWWVKIGVLFNGDREADAVFVLDIFTILEMAFKFPPSIWPLDPSNQL